MSIVNLTHDQNGNTLVRRTITQKVAIGLPPQDGSNAPKRLDHFIFLKKVLVGKDIKWVPDQTLIDHYKQNCREIWIVFLDDDADQVFRTEYAAYVKRGCWCRGDGVTAQRRALGADGRQWGEFQSYKGPCAEGRCPNLHEEGNAFPCSPSGDLYFMLADFPTLGSICRFHTGSYQSIRQIHSALHDLRRITGRLMGVSAKLFMHPDKNVYEQGGQTRSGTKWVVGLELRAADMASIQTKMLETARVFQNIKGELAGQVLQLDEDDTERGAELTPEFYPAAAQSGQPAQTATGDGMASNEEAEEVNRAINSLFDRLGLNEAKRAMLRSQFSGKPIKLMAQLELWANGRTPLPPELRGETPKQHLTAAVSTTVITAPKEDPTTITAEEVHKAQPQRHGGFSF